MHSLPGEVFDFLALIPYLHDGTVIILHDLVNNFVDQNFIDEGRDYTRDAGNVTKLLFDTVTAEKYLMRDNSNQELGCLILVPSQSTKLRANI